ncbi:MAG: glyoxalase [Lachnospiraceae bacterium]
MYEYDDAVLSCFLKDQLKLFPEKVAETREEAEEFLTDCLAVVLQSEADVMEYFEEEGVDLEDRDADALLEIEEVFAVGDGRYLIVEG